MGRRAKQKSELKPPSGLKIARLQIYKKMHIETVIETVADFSAIVAEQIAPRGERVKIAERGGVHLNTILQSAGLIAGRTPNVSLETFIAVCNGMGFVVTIKNAEQSA